MPAEYRDLQLQAWPFASGPREHVCNRIAARFHELDRQHLSLFIFMVWCIAGVMMYTGFTWGDTDGDDGTRHSFIEALYIMAQIVTTVGYGDFIPSSDCGRIVTSIYALAGVVIVASLVGEAADAILENQQRIVMDSIANIEFGEEGGIPGMSAQQEHTLEMKAFYQAFGMWMCFIVAGTAFFTLYPGEELRLVEAVYLSIITLTTVGFGDITPKTSTGRLFASIWMLLGVSAFANMVAKFSVAFFSRGVSEAVKQQRATLGSIVYDPIFKRCWEAQQNQSSALLDLFGAGAELFGASSANQVKVGRADFILFMLKDMGLVDSSVVEKLSVEFDKIDGDGSGFLDMAEVEHTGFELGK